MLFRSNPGTENALKWAGFDIINLANNHTYNFEAEGLLNTLKYLNDVGIQYVGAGENAEQAYAPLYFSKNGINFALLSYEAMDIVPADYEATELKPGIAFMRINRMQEAVVRAKTQADIVIVAMHAGEEYVPFGNDLQSNFAHAAIDAGAELVLGDHSHVIQNAEIYKDKLILYNLGNFVMDQMWSDDTRRALIFKGEFSKKGLEKFELTPVVIEHYSQPTPVNGTLADEIVKRLVLPLNKNQKGTTYSFTTSLDQNTQLIDGKVTIYSNNETVWTSPDDWYVSDVELADSLNDGRNLINMSVWKSGNYGEAMPLWESENDTSVKNHLFVFELKDNEVRPVWQSSNLPVPNCDISFYDTGNDGTVELVAYEGQYSESSENTECQPTHLAVFRWNQWGFYNESRSPIY
jgi:hypothetical protein